MLKKFTLLISCLLLITLRVPAQFTSLTPLDPVEVSTTTGEKPQSKVWFYEGSYWGVLPNNSGTYLWRLDGTSWTSVLQLSGKNTSKADCKLIDNTAHILLYQGRNSELVSVEYNPEEANYQLWSQRSSTVKLAFDSGVETATIDIDGTGRMWLASDGRESIFVRWSDSPYTLWSAPIALEDKVTEDDISAVIAMPGKIGVLWSNQNMKRFGFKIHIDGDDPHNWSEDEVPASQSAIDQRGGMADDHLNLAVSDDGTLYCAVKTSYDHKDYPEIALLVRRPDGTWDDLYDISHKGTRPIVILNEEASKVVIIYTSSDTGGDILYKESLTESIEFGEAYVLISGKYNNPTSAKANYSNEAIVLASSSTHAVGVLANDPTVPLPVELLSFSARRTGTDALLEWATASETNNDYFSIEVSTDGRIYNSIATIPGHGTTTQMHRYTFTDPGITRYAADALYYRLRQVDYSGDYTLSSVRVVHPGKLPEALAIEAYPNPFNSFLQVIISSPQSEQAILSLHNMQGKTVYTEQVALVAGHYKTHLQNITLDKGVYFLTVRAGTEQRVLKLVQH